ncbi:MAG: 16S rRNA (adenine(1518)-N(6)/adenine(1519)-N(6))-dimethyltransferase RsmA [Patescibacteria group bacterium]|jgi:16S rRNA (adenine1518-N6/adenine1519-N6)-dimethyltransferase
MTKINIFQQLKQLNIRPNTDIGQNFLCDETVLKTIIDTYKCGVETPRGASLQKTDTIVEIGPGLGILTEQLVKHAKRVIAIELDRRLISHLQQVAQQYPNLEIVQNDALQVNLADFGLSNGSYSVVANLPYQITAQILRKLLTEQPYPKQMVLLVQKEVAERIVAKPGQLSILAISVQAYCKPKIIKIIPPAAFYPAPKVHSAILELSAIHQQDLIPTSQEKLFFSVVKAGFAQKRKLLIKNLVNATFKQQQLEKKILEQFFLDSQISWQARAQELSLNQWLELVDKFESFMI